MPTLSFPLQAVVATLDNAACWARVLFFPELSAYGEDRAAALDDLRQLGIQVLETLSPRELHQRQPTELPQVRQITIEVSPATSGPGWRTPIPLNFHIVCWSHGAAAGIAYIPALDIEVVAPTVEALDALVADHIRFALLRNKAAGSLDRLLWFSRFESVEIELLTVSAEVKTPQQRAQDSGEKKESVLEKVGSRLTELNLEPSYGLDQVVRRVAEYLTAASPRSVLLVGPSGVGKTATVRELVRRRKERGLGSHAFWATSGAKLVAGMSGFGAWQERCQQVCQEARDTRAIIHFGNLVELLQVGRSEYCGEGIAQFLRPFFLRGELRGIVEATHEQIRLVERESPNLLDAFEPIEIHEPSPEEGRAILRQFVSARASPSTTRRPKHGPPGVTDDALDTLERLHRRYATYSVWPGRPLRFAGRLLADTPEGTTLGSDDVVSAFSRETGLPRLLLDDDVPLELASTRAWFNSRVLGQPRATQVVVDLLTTIKATLSRPHRPLASLLLIGPTGVGKTELAKTLAEFLYQDRGRLTRIDMGEYADPWAVERLIGGPAGAEGTLTAKVREQPFSIVLLDEFEKAHPRFFDLLLQVLGEGRLTDTSGRLAEFRSSVIIMTSNLGTDSFARPALGFSRSPSWLDEAESHFVRAVEQHVRPELYNRIDRIIPFLPLEADILQAIAERQLQQLGQRDGLRRRPFRLQIAPEVAAEVVRVAYDPRYGARPIKRAVDRLVAIPLAAAINEYSSEMPLRASVFVTPRGMRTEVRAQTKEDHDPAGEAVQVGEKLRARSEQVVEFRRDVARLSRCQPIRNLRNEVYRLKRLQERTARRTAKRLSQPDAHGATNSQLNRLQNILDRADALVHNVDELCDEMLLAYHASDPAARRALYDEVGNSYQRTSREHQSLCVDLYRLDSDEPDAATMAFYSQDSEVLQLLLPAYLEMLERRSLAATLYQIALPGKKWGASERDLSLGDSGFKARSIALPPRPSAEFFATLTADVPGIALRVTGRMCGPLLTAEQGLHVVLKKRRSMECLVDVSAAGVAKYLPPPRINRQDAFANRPTRRKYDLPRQQVEDPVLRKTLRWTGHNLEDLLSQLLQERFDQQLREWLDS